MLGLGFGLRWIRSIVNVMLAVGFLKAYVPVRAGKIRSKMIHSWDYPLPSCAVYIMTRRCDKG